MYGQVAEEAEIVCVGTMRSTGQVVQSRVVGDAGSDWMIVDFINVKRNVGY